MFYELEKSHCLCLFFEGIVEQVDTWLMICHLSLTCYEYLMENKLSMISTYEYSEAYDF